MYTLIIGLGIAAFVFLFLTVLSGLKYIKLSFKAHKSMGIVAAVFALSHVTLFLLYNFVI